MTVMTMEQFNADRAMAGQAPLAAGNAAGKPVIGEPIPTKYKIPSPEPEGSPLENTRHFADPRETNACQQAHNHNVQFGSGSFRDVRSIENDPNVSQSIKDRFRGLPDYSALYGQDKDIKEYRGYVIRKDPTYNYWIIDNIPGMFTKISFAYDKIDSVLKIMDNPEMQERLAAQEQIARNLLLKQTQNDYAIQSETPQNNN